MQNVTATITNRPLKTFRSGAVQAAIWKKEPAAGGIYFSVTLNRSYKQDDQWRNSESFDSRDLLDVRRVLTSAEQFIGEQPLE